MKSSAGVTPDLQSRGELAGLAVINNTTLFILAVPDHVIKNWF